MITCPECGQQANDNAQFCDRCGQGFAGSSAHPAATSISSLDPDTELKGGYRIIVLLSRTAHENRYRALRQHDNQLVQLREQPGPSRQPDEAPVSSEAYPTSSGEDPAGPRAKTAELRMESLAGRNSANGVITQSSRSEPASDATPPPAEKEAAADVSRTVQEGNAGYAEAAEGADEVGVQLLTEL
ncbi:MAG: hypothetical protein JO071_01875, partial [Deltaproteobacteria bacterium]|nr:hypothetical protein [Deltaproteobacteria bacterium]